MLKVLIVEPDTPILDRVSMNEVFERNGIHPKYTSNSEVDDLIDELKGCMGIIVHSGVQVDRRIIESHHEQLSVIGRGGIGVDNVDLSLASEYDIVVVHHPTYCIDEVAAHTFSLLMAGFRRLNTYHQQACVGEWSWQRAAPIRRFSGATLGLVGFGNIPQRISIITQGTGLDVIAHDPYMSDDQIRSFNVEPVDIQALWARSDMISLHTPLTDETRGLIDAAAIEYMSDEVVLVNTARGPIIDTDALIEALESDSVGSVCLDVTDPEPLLPDHQLLSFDNVLVTPHTAWYSEEARHQLSADIASDVCRVIHGEEPMFPITAPPG